MSTEKRDFDEFLEKFKKHRDLMVEELHKVIVGQDEVIDQILAAIFTGGHCLLVGVPGLAKTLIVSTIARISGRAVSAHPVHARPDAVGHHRHQRPGRNGHRPP